MKISLNLILADKHLYELDINLDFVLGQVDLVMSLKKLKRTTN